MPNGNGGSGHGQTLMYIAGAIAIVGIGYYLHKAGYFNKIFDAINKVQPSTNGKGKYHYEPYRTFNGTSDFIDILDVGALDLVKFSIAVWFRTTKNYFLPTADDAEGEEGMMVVKGKHTGKTSPYMNYGIWVTDHNGLRGGFRTSGGTEYMANSLILRQSDGTTATGPGSNDGKWHLGVVTHDGATVKLYFDSVLHASVTTGGAKPDSTSTPLRIGANNFEFVNKVEAGPKQYFKGDLDEVRVWKSVINQAEITALYSAGIVPQQSAIVYENTFGGSGSRTALAKVFRHLR